MQLIDDQSEYIVHYLDFNSIEKLYIIIISTEHLTDFDYLIRTNIPTRSLNVTNQRLISKIVFANSFHRRNDFVATHLFCEHGAVVSHELMIERELEFHRDSRLEGFVEQRYASRPPALHHLARA